MRGLSILFITHDLSLGYYISEESVILYSGRIAEKGSTDKIYFNPLHPYTKMLMSCVPRVDQKWQDVDIELRGKNIEPTGGCVYARRCPFAFDRCREAPPLTEFEEITSSLAGRFLSLKRDLMVAGQLAC